MNSSRSTLIIYILVIGTLLVLLSTCARPTSNPFTATPQTAQTDQ